ncbi:AIPR family protein [Streptomyces sp. NPDC004311]|uniref:AIPR family protein n=1 Tax=Streptomyces sp. NPDC004311 TaxID=3364698 RepID=UPI0036902167
MSDALESALAQRDDLNRYKAAKRMLFALQLSLDLEDIHSVAATALTDGPDDKSCDLVYIDRDSRSMILAQGYEAGNVDQLQAPLTKGTSLHQAVNWLFGSTTENGVPLRLRSAWRELHDALTEGALQTIEIWFVHNLPENMQIAEEMQAVANATYGIISSRYNVEGLSVTGAEVGRNTLSDRYEGSRTPILVGDTFEIPVSGTFTETGDNWSALCASIPASWLREQFAVHKERLFSANIRGYLGSTRSQSNINNGIQATVRDQPGRFWAYNNGITALVHSFKDRDGESVEITGIAIVNGAQTTGALGSTDSDGIDEVKILARFIKCDDAATVQDIVRYNNRQNPTQASDFRSNDRVQSRLVKDFEGLGVVGYNGGRRGGAEDVIRRPGENQVAASVAAQALAAFHGRPDVAYHEKGQIWEQDAIYSSVFPERVSARHILFVYSLLRALEQSKASLGSRSTTPHAQTLRDQELAKWFGMRGSTFLAVSAVGASIESVLDAPVSDQYSLEFKKNLTVPKAIESWLPVTTALLALAPDQLSSPLSSVGGLRNRTSVDAAINTFRAVVSATSQVNKPIYADFASQIRS